MQINCISEDFFPITGKFHKKNFSFFIYLVMRQILSYMNALILNISIFHDDFKHLLYYLRTA